MPHLKKPPAQTCKLCGYTGHNRRRCHLGPAATRTRTKLNGQTLARSKSNSRNISESKVNKPLTVQVVSDAHASPHVMNLKTNAPRESLVQSLPVYRERSRSGVGARQTVNFGELVRAANLRAAGARSAPLRHTLTAPRHSSASARTRTRAFSSLFQLPMRAWSHAIDRVSAFTRTFNLEKFAYGLAVLVALATMPYPAVAYYRSLQATSGEVKAESGRAFQALESGAFSVMRANLADAERELNVALQSFSTVDGLLRGDHRLLLSVASFLPVIGPEIKSREYLLSAGQRLALGNTYLVKGMADAAYANDLPLTDRLALIEDRVRSAAPQYEHALESISHIDTKTLPEQYHALFGDFKLLLAAVVADLGDLSHLSQALELMFGSDQFRRYLVVFQNPDELRPTGGFVGSLALVDVQKGKITDIDVPGGGPYDLNGQLTAYVKPPVPLQIVNSRWEFQDANWFPDFPASAKKLSWFYQKSRGTTVDGVIAVNASVLIRVLNVLGPVSAGAHDVSFDADTGILSLQKEVEVNYDKQTNQPKTVIGDLLHELTARLQTIAPAQAVALLGTLQEALAQKEIQLYMNDDGAQTILKSFGWTGELFATPDTQDYLAVVNANIRGEKSDAKIAQQIEHQAVVAPDGSVTDTVIISRAHRGLPGEQFYGGVNMSYLRVYAPAGAELLDAGGFNFPPEDAFRVPEPWYQDDADLENYERDGLVHAPTGTRVTREFGKTVFGNWVATAPGSTSTAYVVYRLPFKLPAASLASNRPSVLAALWQSGDPLPAARYSLAVQKQSGIESALASSVIFPAGWVPVWKSDDAVTLAKNGAQVYVPLISDMVYGVVMQKPQ